MYLKKNPVLDIFFSYIYINMYMYTEFNMNITLNFKDRSPYIHEEYFWHIEILAVLIF